MIESTSYYIQLEEGEATDSTIGSTFDSRVDSRVDSRIGSRVDERNDEGLTRVSYWTAQVGESNAAYGHKYTLVYYYVPCTWYDYEHLHSVYLYVSYDDYWYCRTTSTTFDHIYTYIQIFILRFQIA